MDSSVERVLKDKSINYQLTGRDFVIKCLNPEHDDLNPSMRVDRVSGVFNCFSCGFSGNIFTHYGLIQDSVTNQKAIQLIDYILDLKKESFKYPLPSSMPYKESFRNIDSKTIQKFEAFTNTSMPELIDRICFPIRNTLNEVYAVIARDMFTSKGNKYNVYPAGSPLWPFPSVVEPINSTIFIVEGIFDMLNMHQHGATNTVALMGVSAGLVKKSYKKEKWRKVFSRYKLQGATNIKIMLDNDKTGKLAAEGLESLLSDSFFVEIIRLKGAKDPNELSKEQIKVLLEEKCNG